MGQSIKNPSAIGEIWLQFLGREDPLEEGMERIPVFLPEESTWTEVPGWLQSMGFLGVRQHLATKHSTPPISMLYIKS